jgi:two-component system, response regulator RegA
MKADSPMNIESLEKLLLVDDDISFCHVMQRALSRRGFQVEVCHNIVSAEAALREHYFQKAIIDLKIAHESGLTLIKNVKAINSTTEIIMLTGYSSVSTAVEAIKLGATNYFCKPIGVDDILSAFTGSSAKDFSEFSEVALPESPPSLDRIEWEHIQKTLNDNSGNISETARILGMYRRTLQRKLQKKPASH